jgi:hypothetical protein
MDDLRLVLDRLARVKRYGDGYLASCPVPEHGKGGGDQHQSLIVQQLPNGRIRYHCFAGCLPQRVAFCIGLELDGAETHYRTTYQRKPKPVPRACVDWLSFIRRAEAALTDALRRRLADRLGITRDAMAYLHIGWSPERSTYTFPVRDDRLAWTGIQLRRQDGRRYCVTGTRARLFLPDRLPPNGPIIVCEGASDTLYAASLGLAAIGRYNASQTWDHLAAYLYPRSRGGRREVVMCSDYDLAGTSGAAKCAGIIARFATVRIVKPLRGKDLRDWRPTRREFLTAAQAVRPFRP